MYIRMLSPHGGISLCQCDYSIAVSFYITETLVADVSVFYIFKKLFLRFAGIRVYILAQCDSMIFFALQSNLQIKSALKLVFPDMISGLMNLISFLILFEFMVQSPSHSQLFEKRMLVLQMKLCIQIDMFHFVG